MYVHANLYTININLFQILSGARMFSIFKKKKMFVMKNFTWNPIIKKSIFDFFFFAITSKIIVL